MVDLSLRLKKKFQGEGKSRTVPTASQITRDLTLLSIKLRSDKLRAIHTGLRVTAAAREGNETRTWSKMSILQLRSENNVSQGHPAIIKGQIELSGRRCEPWNKTFTRRNRTTNRPK